MHARFGRWTSLSVFMLWLLPSLFSPASAKGPFALALVLSPDGTRLYLAGQVLQGQSDLITTLWTIDTATLQVVATVQPKGNPYLSSMAVSPDGARLYLGRDGGIDVLDALSYQRLAAVATGATPSSLAVSPDGRRLTMTYADVIASPPHQPPHMGGGLKVVDTTTNHVMVTLNLKQASEFVAVSPDDQRTYVITSSNPTQTIPVGDTVTVIDAATLQVVATVPLGGLARVAALSPDGKQLYVTTYSRSTGPTRISIIDTATEQVVDAVKIPDTQYFYTTPPVISPDGKRLYVPMAGARASLRVLDTESRQFTGSLTLPRGAFFPALSPDGKRLYTVDQVGDTITVIDAGSLQPEATIQPGQSSAARN